MEYAAHPPPTLSPHSRVSSGRTLPQSRSSSAQGQLLPKRHGGAAARVDPGAHHRQPASQPTSQPAAAQRPRLGAAEQRGGVEVGGGVELFGVALRHVEPAQLGVEHARGEPARLVPARRRRARRLRWAGQLERRQ
eukprot:scaffold44413_cov41-Phaeocystis_antarctica.AAC.1